MKFETLDIDTTQFIETRDSDRHGIDLKRPTLFYYKV